jgi:glycosyltransferase involved in cell wall biosynthesis
MPTAGVRALLRHFFHTLLGKGTRPTFDARSPRDLARLLAKFDLPAPADDARHARGPGVADRVREVYQLRADVREVFPLGLTPAQLHDYGDWLLRYGRSEYAFDADEVLRFLYEQAEDPSKGLGETYLLTPEWQHAVPDAFTEHGWRELKRWLTRRYRDHVGRWVRAAERPPHATVPANGATINLLGHFKYESGLQEEILRQAETLSQHGFHTYLRDLPVSFPRVVNPDRRYLDPELGDITIIKLGAQLRLDQAYRRAGWHPRPGVYRIVCWSWEVEEFPPAAVEGAAGLASEVWTVSEFCARSVRRAMPGVPVHTMPVVIPPSPVEWRPRADFGLPDGRFLFLFAFDMASGMERKNPLGLIRAFRLAFAPAEPVHLALKVSRGREHPNEFARLAREADAAGVTVIDRVVPRPEVQSLLAACDSYVSLHRSEGFGMTMAEAMLLGKPTIATGYSGNLDFMTAENSYLVDAHRVSLDRDCPPYAKGCTWSEPSVEHAARLMRQVYERRDEALAVAARGRAAVEAGLSPAAVARRMLARINDIRSHPVRRRPE